MAVGQPNEHEAQMQLRAAFHAFGTLRCCATSTLPLGEESIDALALHLVAVFQNRSGLIRKILL